MEHQSWRIAGGTALLDGALRPAEVALADGRIADAARTLGIQRTNLYRMMRRLNLVAPKAARRELKTD